MIQRQQTIWWFLIGVFAVLMLFFDWMTLFVTDGNNYTISSSGILKDGNTVIDGSVQFCDYLPLQEARLAVEAHNHFHRALAWYIRTCGVVPLYVYLRGSYRHQFQLAARASAHQHNPRHYGVQARTDGRGKSTLARQASLMQIINQTLQNHRLSSKSVIKITFFGDRR